MSRTAIKALITGGDGQLGKELQRVVPDTVDAVVLGHSALDITNEASVTAAFEEYDFDVVINAAAYTDVDGAESEADVCRDVNVQGPKLLAMHCRMYNARLVHISTDFVFTDRHCSPIPTTAETDPAGVYATTKREGEVAVREVLGEEAAIVRTSWLYSAFGGNFVQSMIRLMNERDELGIVYDQVGTPTWAGTLAQSLWSLLEAEEFGGLWHISNAGVASWYDFAVAIYGDASAFGLIESECEIRPIRTSDYPTPAQRPAYSVLDPGRAWDNGILKREHWRTSLRTMLGDLM